MLALKEVLALLEGETPAVREAVGEAGRVLIKDREVMGATESVPAAVPVKGSEWLGTGLVRVLVLGHAMGKRKEAPIPTSSTLPDAPVPSRLAGEHLEPLMA